MLSVLFGIIGIAVGICWLVMWGAWAHFLVVLQGSVPPFMILVGLVAFAAGVSSIKDNAAAKKEEKKLEEEAAVEAPSEPAEAEAEEAEEETDSDDSEEEEKKED